jgi:Fe-S cluster assembly protein SufD
MRNQKSKTIIISELVNNLSESLSDNSDFNLYVIDVNEFNTTFNLEVKIKKFCNLKIVVSVLNNQKNLKNFNVNIIHEDDSSNSEFYYYTVCSDESRSFCTVQTQINKNGYATETKQIIKGIMLSDKCRIHGEPKLIIDNNEVKAKHALAIGQMNKENLYYLMSKGISEKMAKRLIVVGFFNEVLVNIDDESQREDLKQRIEEKLNV